MISWKQVHGPRLGGEGGKEGEETKTQHKRAWGWGAGPTPQPGDSRLLGRPLEGSSVTTGLSPGSPHG